MTEEELNSQIEATIWLFEQKKVRSHEEKADLLRRLCACATDSGKPLRENADLDTLTAREYAKKYYHTVLKPRRQAERAAQKREEHHAEN